MFERLKQLLSQTAAYGLSSILGRFINVLLLPIHTTTLSQSEFGINADIYVIIAFLIVILVYGMETSFFMFSEKSEYKRDEVFSTALVSIFSTTLLFSIVSIIFFGDITSLLRYDEYPEYLVYLFIILLIDVLAAIPFAWLRSNNKVFKFVSIKLTLIFVNILLNLFFLVYCPKAIEGKWVLSDLIAQFFDSNNLVQYVFISNVIGNIVVMLMLMPIFFQIKWTFNPVLLQKMVKYGIPLLLAGLAGLSNEMLDRQFIKYLLPESISNAQLGIYAAVYKLSIFLVLFNQAFRYAAEPFFFSTQNDKNSKGAISIVMKYFTMVMAIGMVFIMCYIDIIKQFFLGKDFWEGIYILPLLLLANVFLGINTNLSIWYKLTDKTKYGIVITGVGLIFTIMLNVMLIPRIGYEGAAWATLVSYFAMMATSYVLGQKYYPIKYPINKMFIYIILACVAVWLALQSSNSTFVPQTLVFIGYLATIVLIEKNELLEIKNRLVKK